MGKRVAAFFTAIACRARHVSDGVMHPKTLISRAAPVVHLMDMANPRSTLCGLPIGQCVLGAYAEQLAESSEPDGTPQWERTIFPLEGRFGQPCPQCLKAQTPILGAGE